MFIRPSRLCDARSLTSLLCCKGGCGHGPLFGQGLPPGACVAGNGGVRSPRDNVASALGLTAGGASRPCECLLEGKGRRRPYQADRAGITPLRGAAWRDRRRLGRARPCLGRRGRRPARPAAGPRERQRPAGPTPSARPAGRPPARREGRPARLGPRNGWGRWACTCRAARRTRGPSSTACCAGSTACRRPRGDPSAGPSARADRAVGPAGAGQRHGLPTAGQRPRALGRLLNGRRRVAEAAPRRRSPQPAKLRAPGPGTPCQPPAWPCLGRKPARPGGRATPGGAGARVALPGARTSRAWPRGLPAAVQRAGPAALRSAAAQAPRQPQVFEHPGQRQLLLEVGEVDAGALADRPRSGEGVGGRGCFPAPEAKQPST
jgi:hypothetical protein